MSISEKWLSAGVWMAVAVAYVFGLWVPVMNVDAAQYAAISAEMYRTGEYLQVKCRGFDYLDKPPLLFWLSALTFHVLGVSTATYKLFSLAAVALAVFSVWQLGRHLYDEATGRRAALLLATFQAFFLFANDVRTDTLLTGLVALAIWQLYRYGEHRKNIHLFLGSFAVGLAMLAKGPIGLVAPASAVGVHWLLKRQWNVLFRWQWALGAGIIFITLAPMLYGLHQQHGWHGVKFFLWTQSFGRITGENPWRNEAGFFYFWKELLWICLPWTLWVLASLLWQLAQLVRHRFAAEALREYVSLAGFFLPFLALSLSQYKLPHYVFVVLPMAALFSARGTLLLQAQTAAFRVMAFLQMLVLAGMLAVALLLNGEYFPVRHAAWWIPFCIMLAVAIMALWRKIFNPTRLFAAGALVAAAVNFMMNAQFYPQLLRYQSGIVIAGLLQERGWDTLTVAYMDYDDYSLEFYLGRSLPWYNRQTTDSLLAVGTPLVLIGRKAAADLMETGSRKPLSVDTIGHYHVSTLSMPFLRRETRQQVLENVYVVRY